MSNASPRLDQIVTELRSRLGRTWQPGDRLPPITELARRLDVGQTNTYRAVQQLVRQGLLVSQPRRGTFVAEDCLVDRPLRDNARLDLIGKSVTLLTAWDKPDPFITRAIDAAAETLRDLGAEPRTRKIPKDHKLRSFRDADALIAVNPMPRPMLRPRPDQPLAIVTTAADAIPDIDAGYDIVNFDSLHAGYLAGAHLKACKCRRVCFVGVADSRSSKDAPRYDATSWATLQGLEAALGSPITSDLQLIGNAYMTIEASRLVNDFVKLSPIPQGVCVASDELAVGFVIAAAAFNLEAGRDYQLISFDGQEFGRALPIGALTTIRAPMPEMGAEAARLIAKRITDPSRPPQRISLPGDVILGVTSRPR